MEHLSSGIPNKISPPCNEAVSIDMAEEYRVPLKLQRRSKGLFLTPSGTSTRFPGALSRTPYLPKNGLYESNRVLNEK